MEELLELLRDGNSRSVEMIAAELNSSPEDVLRKIDFMERAGIIRRVTEKKDSCGKHKCSDCSNCSRCQPKGGFKGMGEIWEVVQ
ncbi:MAG: Lrp/AsnC family transcriptional regulator [Treponema sp.]|nr:Lrp/AsnC family transcriptional regulator [Treponema sp.]